MKFHVSKARFNSGVVHVVPSVAVIYDHKVKGLSFDVAFAKWEVVGGVEFSPSKKNAKRKK